MAEELKPGCTRPSTSVAAEPEAPVAAPSEQADLAKKEMSMIHVGKKAPDFTAPGYHNKNFVNVTLSEYLGKWVVLCFYPGDFTFV